MKEQIMNYVTGIAHLALNVPDIVLAQKQYEALGFVEDKPGFIKEDSFKIVAKVMRLGAYTIELCMPLNEDLQPSKYEVGKSYTIDHICYEVSDIDAQIEILRKNKFTQISPRRISDVCGKPVVLMANRKMGVIELMER